MNARIKLVRALVIGLATVVLGILSIMPRTMAVAPVSAETAGEASDNGATLGAEKGKAAAVEEYSSTGEEEESSGGSCG